MLYVMVNPKNLKVVSMKLLQKMSTTNDQQLKENLALKLLALCDRFDAQFQWYIETINQVGGF